MITLTAAMLTLLLLVAWGCARFVVWDIPEQLYAWISGHSWGTASWWAQVVQWFTVPLCWLLVFVALWLLTLVLLGWPPAILRHHGLRPALPSEHRATFRSRHWQRMFALCCPSMDGQPPAKSFVLLQVIAWIGVIAATVAAFPLAALLTHIPFFNHAVFPWLRRPSIPLVLFLVAFGIRRACKSCVAIVTRDLADKPGEPESTAEGLHGLMSELKHAAEDAADVLAEGPQASAEEQE